MRQNRNKPSTTIERKHEKKKERPNRTIETGTEIQKDKKTEAETKKERKR